MRPISGITILGFRLGIITLVVYWLSLFVGTHLPGAVAIASGLNDKQKHCIAFFVLTVLLCYVWPTSDRTWQQQARRCGWAFTILLVYAVLDEVTQHFSPGRTPDRYDVVADMVGVALALALYTTASRLFARAALRTISTPGSTADA